MGAVGVPAVLQDHYRNWDWSVAWSYDSVVTTWRLRHPGGQVRYLKVKHVGSSPRLLDEADRLSWAASYLPVPIVVDAGTELDVDFLVTEALAGRNAISDDLRADPLTLVPILASGLRRFHEAPRRDCPFRMTPSDAIATVRARLQRGLIDPVKDFHIEHSHLSLDAALAELEPLADFREDPVVCHGDYCLPNVLIDEGEVVGYVDLGELTVADRWWDLAVGAWSVTWNLGPGWEDLFYDSYGFDVEPDKVGLFRLLYDMIS